MQKVVKKWGPKIGEHWCRDFAPSCWVSVWSGRKEINVKLATLGHRDCVLEMMLAMSKVIQETHKPFIWVLNLCSGGEGWETMARSFKKMQELIKQSSGITFTTRALEKAADRLRINDDENAE